MPHFIAVYPNVISDDMCAEIVRRFEADPRRQPSHVFADKKPELRSGTLLNIGGDDNWKEIKQLLLAKFSECLHDYAKQFKSLENILREDCEISGFVIERVDPGQGFNWHIDSGPKGTHDRFLSVLYYLNDVDEGGETEFEFQDFKFTPRAGSLVMFPPYWTHIHRGTPPISNTKYKISSHCTLKS